MPKRIYGEFSFFTTPPYCLRFYEMGKSKIDKNKLTKTTSGTYVVPVFFAPKTPLHRHSHFIPSRLAPKTFPHVSFVPIVKC